MQKPPPKLRRIRRYNVTKAAITARRRQIGSCMATEQPKGKYFDGPMTDSSSQPFSTLLFAALTEFVASVHFDSF